MSAAQMLSGDCLGLVGKIALDGAMTVHLCRVDVGNADALAGRADDRVARQRRRRPGIAAVGALASNAAKMVIEITRTAQITPFGVGQAEIVPLASRVPPRKEKGPSRFRLSPCLIWWSQAGSNR
jgi:hypothetical protein